MKSNRRFRFIAVLFWLAAIAGCATAPTTLHGIGVYEGSYPSGVLHSYGYHPDGSIDVSVHTKGRPVILALSSYEPVVWNIKLDDGVVIKEIILSGHHPSKVVGVESNVRITRQGFGFAYAPDARHSELAKKLKEYTGLDVENFQGMYTGKEFSVH
ncbi:MAG: hypothetical protein ABIK82_09280 [Pseudomonadota bacterium]